MKNQQNHIGFTLVEVLVYIVIAAALLTVLTTLVINIFNARRQLVASHLVQQNARFIYNFFNSSFHSTEYIVDVSPELEHYHFYLSDTARFSIAQENNNLIFRQVEDSGAGFPAQSTGQPIILNSNNVRVENFSLIAVADSEGTPLQGVQISFSLITGSPAQPFGYVNENFSTFLSIRR